MSIEQREQSPLAALITHEGVCPSCTAGDLACPTARELYHACKASWEPAPAETARSHPRH